MYSSVIARQDMESVLQHPDMTKITNGNSILEEVEEDVNADMDKHYDKYPEILPIEPLQVSQSIHQH